MEVKRAGPTPRGNGCSPSRRSHAVKTDQRPLESALNGFPHLGQPTLSWTAREPWTMGTRWLGVWPSLPLQIGFLLTRVFVSVLSPLRQDSGGFCSYLALPQRASISQKSEPGHRGIWACFLISERGPAGTHLPGEVGPRGQHRESAGGDSTALRAPSCDLTRGSSSKSKAAWPWPAAEMLVSVSWRQRGCG